MFGSVVAQGQRGMRKTVASREPGAKSEEQGDLRNEKRRTSNAEVSRQPSLKRPATRRFAQSPEQRKDKAGGREEKSVERAFGPLGSGIGSRFYRSLRRILAQRLSAASTGGETTRSNPGIDRANIA